MGDALFRSTFWFTTVRDRTPRCCLDAPSVLVLDRAYQRSQSACRKECPRFQNSADPALPSRSPHWPQSQSSNSTRATKRVLAHASWHFCTLESADYLRGTKGSSAQTECKPCRCQ